MYLIKSRYNNKNSKNRVILIFFYNFENGNIQKARDMPTNRIELLLYVSAKRAKRKEDDDRGLKNNSN